jgi:probable F420-dependent oxidoreductase
MSDRRFRFGLIAGQVRAPETWTGLARRAESLGYATFLAADLLASDEPLAALATAAGATRSIRLGSFVLCDAFRNPRLLAWQVASLNALSGGRFELGIGAGRPAAAEDCRRLGIPFGSGAERVARLAATLGILKEPSGEQNGAAGQARPPILVAGSGPRLLALAAREADSVALGWPPDTTETAARQVVERVRQAAPDRFDDLELNSTLLAVGDDPPPWLRQYGFDPAQLLRDGAVTVLGGTPRQMADELLRRRDALGVSYVTTSAAFAEVLAPVVAELTGR